MPEAHKMPRMTIPLRLAAGAIALLLTGAGPMDAGHHFQPSPPRATFLPNHDAVPFELFRASRIFIPASLNGTKTDIMFDSGAGVTVVDSAFAKKAGLRGGIEAAVQGTGGSMPSRIISGVTLDVGSLRLTGLTVFVMDMSQVARAIGHAVPVVLGRDALKASVVTFDFPNRTLRFAEEKGFHAPADAVRLPAIDDGYQFWTPISVVGLPPVDAQIDLGNGGTIAVSKDYWSAQPAIANLRYAHSQTGGVGGMKAARRVMLSDVSFAGIRFTDVPATLNEDAATLPSRGANIGIELLKPFVVTFDVAGKAVYLQGTGSVPPLEHERVGVRAEFAGDRLIVAFVSPEGPGAAAGLKPGDQIVAVDGVKVDSSYFGRPDWTRGPVGQTTTLTLADGREAKVTLADYF